MECIEALDPHDVIDKFEYEDDKIKVIYCDDTYEYVENTKENERKLLIEELNRMKIFINIFKNYDFDDGIAYLDRKIRINNTLNSLAVGSIVLSSMIMMNKLDMNIEMKIIDSAIIYKLSSYITNFFGKLASKYEGEQTNLIVIEEMIRRDQLYINNMDILKYPIKLVDKENNRYTDSVIITPNNIDDYSYDDIDFCIRASKHASKYKKQLKKER